MLQHVLYRLLTLTCTVPDKQTTGANIYKLPIDTILVEINNSSVTTGLEINSSITPVTKVKLKKTFVVNKTMSP